MIKQKISLKKYENVISVIIACVISFVFLTESPLHPFRNNEIYTDSSVFKTVAMMMQKGYMPYKDSFDHKGPLTYIINYFGNLIAEYRGVWVIEFIFMCITLWMMYKTARLFCNKVFSAVATVTAETALFEYFDCGNYTEEYAMMFISVSLFIFIDYLQNDRTTNLRIVISGLCLGGTLLLRPNMISLWIVMCIAVLIKNIGGHGHYANRWKCIIQFTILFTIGVLIIVLPIVIWLVCKDAFFNFWNDYIVFNFAYTSGSSIFNKWKSLFHFFSSTFFLISFLGLLFSMRNKQGSFLNYAYLIYMIVSILFICLSGRTYRHYGMILVPMYVYPLALMFGQIELICEKHGSMIVASLTAIYFIISIIMPSWNETIQDFPGLLLQEMRNSNQLMLPDNVRTISDYIINNTSEDDKISVYGNWDIIYVLTNRCHATTYSYQFPIGKVKPEIMEDYFDQLERELPPVIVVANKGWDERIQDFLEVYNYRNVWSEDSTEGAMLFARNRVKELPDISGGERGAECCR